MPSYKKIWRGVVFVVYGLLVPGALFGESKLLRKQFRGRALLQDANAVPNPDDDNAKPSTAYSLKADLNWWDKYYIPTKNGGSSKVPMEDGLTIAKTAVSKHMEKGTTYALEPIEAPMADMKGKPFKPGTDDEYMAMKSGKQEAKQNLAAGDPSKPKGGDFTEDAQLINGGKEIGVPGVGNEPVEKGEVKAAAPDDVIA